MNLLEASLRFCDEIEALCNAVIPSSYLLELIEFLKGAEKAQQVSMVVIKGHVDMFAGLPDDANEAKWQIECETGQLPGPEYIYYVMLNLPHEELMRKATSLAPHVYVGITRVPTDHILIHLSLEGLEYMGFLSKVIGLDCKILHDDDDPTGGHSAEASQNSSDTGAAESSQQPGGVAAEAALLSGGDAAEAEEEPAFKRSKEKEVREEEQPPQPPPPLEPEVTMSFEINNPRLRRESLETLIDYEFNPDHVGMVEVNPENGF